MRVVIEAGHSESDPGAVVEGVAEREIVVALAHRIPNLSGNGIEYVPTSRLPERNALWRFCARLLRREPDVVISLHCNSSKTDPDLHCCITYWDGKRRGSAGLANALALSATGKAGFAEKSQVVRAPWDRNGRPYTYLVLFHGRQAAALIEVGFLSDIHARAAMLTEEWQARAVAAIDAGLRAWAGGN